MRCISFGAGCAAMLLGAALLAQHAGAQTAPSECASEFSRDDGDGDGRLAEAEVRRYKRVMTHVDLDGDGVISSDEYLGACAQGIFAWMFTDHH